MATYGYLADKELLSMGNFSTIIVKLMIMPKNHRNKIPGVKKNLRLKGIPVMLVRTDCGISPSMRMSIVLSLPRKQHISPSIIFIRGFINDMYLVEETHRRRTSFLNIKIVCIY